MSVLDDAIAAARAELENPPTAELEIRVGDLLVPVVFSKMKPMEWLDLTSTHEARFGSKRDSNLGFNIHAVVKAAAPLCGRSAEGEPITAEQWSGILEVLDAPDIETLGLTLWGLNQYEALQRTQKLASAPKGSPRKSKPKPA